MTIREVEKALGMTRANIRFYEQEGLLTPRREQNGYRDYSAQDVETLKKIQLLRQLHLELDTIRRLQQGECLLSDALRRQLAVLEGQRAELEEAREICRAMEADGVSYAALRPEDYMERIPRREEGYFAPPLDGTPMLEEPARRFFARLLDLTLYGLLWAVIELLVLRWHLGSGALINLLHSYLRLGLMLALEPLMLSTWGSTPGKWILGLTVRSGSGQKLSYSDALSRTLCVFWQGLGGGIPIYRVYRLYRSWRACTEGEFLSWEEGDAYTLRDKRRLRVAGCAGAYAGALLLIWVVALQSMLPPCRGALTPAQFARNVNDLGQSLGVLGELRLDEEGQWAYPDRENVVWIGGGSGELPRFRYTLEDGRITAVRLEAEDRGDQMPSLWTTQRTLAVLALAWASPEVNIFNFRDQEFLNALGGETEDYTLEKWGVSVTYELDSRGYERLGDMGLYSTGDGDCWYRLVFNVETQPE